MRDLDNKMDVFMSWPGRPNLMAALKELQEASGGDLKQFEKIVAVLKTQGITELKVAGMKCILSDGRKISITVRQVAGLQVTMRTAASILQKSNAKGLKTFWSEARLLKVTVPKELAAKLKELGESAQAQAHAQAQAQAQAQAATWLTHC